MTPDERESCEERLAICMEHGEVDEETARDTALVQVLVPPKIQRLVVHSKVEAYDELIDRRSPWGNPFPLGNRRRIDCIEEYLEWLLSEEGFAVMGRIRRLKSKVLGCWCAPRLCHGHVLAMAANARNDPREPIEEMQRKTKALMSACTD